MLPKYKMLLAFGLAKMDDLTPLVDFLLHGFAYKKISRNVWKIEFSFIKIGDDGSYNFFLSK